MYFLILYHSDRLVPLYLNLLPYIIPRIIIFCLSHGWMAVMHRCDSQRASEDEDDDDVYEQCDYCANFVRWINKCKTLKTAINVITVYLNSTVN